MRHCVEWILVCGVSGLLLASCGGGPSQEAARVQQLNPMPQPFDVLNPYGEWVNLPGRGQVWKPHVTYNWMPYTQGQWTLTDRGWTWMSSEPFGWVVYHYGFWDYEPGLGWVWFPGYQWSPAQVQWFVADNYVGWAPLPPPGVLLPRPEEMAAQQRWAFVPMREFGRERGGAYGSQYPSGVTGRVSGQAPNVRTVEASRGETIPVRRMEMERVRDGTRELLRPHLGDHNPQFSVPPPTPVPGPQPPMNLPVGRERAPQSKQPPATGQPATPTQRNPNAGTRTAPQPNRKGEKRDEVKDQSKVKQRDRGGAQDSTHTGQQRPGEKR